MVKAAHVDKNGVKRGAWSEEEDNKLRAYILRYGHWNWRLLPKFAGLDRCGKSCRLRWMNYLKPGVKRGNYTKEERDLISQLHNEIGNKWSSIAAKLPGRSDNDIKNYWHTHIKKRSRRASPSSKSCQQAAAHETFHEKEKSSEIIHNLGHQKAFPGSDVAAAILCSNKLEKTDYKVSSDTYNVLESSTTSSSSNSASAVNWDLDLSSGRICSSILSCRSSYLGLSWEANDDSSTSSDPFSELIQESFWTEPFVLDTSDHTEDFNCLALDDGGIFAPDFSAYIMPSIYPNSVYKS